MITEDTITFIVFIFLFVTVIKANHPQFNLQSQGTLNNCANYDQNQICLLCDPRHFLKDGKCVRVDDSCAEWNDSTGQCTTCYEGSGDYNQNAVQGECQFRGGNGSDQADVQNIQTTDQANGPTQGGMLTTQQNTSLNTSLNNTANIVYTVPQKFSYNQLSQIVNYVNNDQASSNNTSLNQILNHTTSGLNLDSYSLIQGGSGSMINQSFDFNCRSFNQQRQCIQCFQGYFLDSSIRCQPIPLNCMKFNTSSGLCIQCSLNYTLSTTYQCIISPANNSSNNGQSVIKVQNCIKYFCEGKCIKCDVRYYLTCDHLCQELPFNCLLADMDGECTLCAFTFVLYNGDCYFGSNQDESGDNTNTNSDDNAGNDTNQNPGNNTNPSNNNTANNNTNSTCDINQCKTNNSQATKCLSCFYHSYLTSEGCCQQINGFCSKWQTNGFCNQCYKGYFINPENTRQCILGEIGSGDQQITQNSDQQMPGAYNTELMADNQGRDIVGNDTIDNDFTGNDTIVDDEINDDNQTISNGKLQNDTIAIDNIGKV